MHQIMSLFLKLTDCVLAVSLAPQTWQERSELIQRKERRGDADPKARN